MKKTVLLLAFIFLFSCNNDDNCNTPVTTIECETVDLGITEEDKLIHGGTIIPVPFNFCDTESYLTVSFSESWGTQYRFFIQKNEYCLKPIYVEILNISDYGASGSNFYDFSMKVQEYMPNENLKIKFLITEGGHQIEQKAWIEFKPENEWGCI